MLGARQQDCSLVAMDGMSPSGRAMNSRAGFIDPTVSWSAATVTHQPLGGVTGEGHARHGLNAGSSGVGAAPVQFVTASLRFHAERPSR